MLCTAGRPFLGDTYPAVLAEGCTDFVDLETPPTAEPCMKIRIKPPEWASWELCSSLPCPSSNTELQKPRQGEGRQCDSRVPTPSTAALVQFSGVQTCRVTSEYPRPSWLFPLHPVAESTLVLFTSLKSPLSDWAGIRVQVLFYRADGESLEVMSETRAYLIGWGDVAT